MPQLEIQKERFKEYLEQFIGDVPYEMELLDKLIKQIPENAIEGYITEYFYSHGYFKGTLYKIQHLTYRDDIRYFTDFNELVKYLQEFTLSKKVRDAMTPNSIKMQIHKGIPISGYLIEEIKNAK